MIRLGVIIMLHVGTTACNGGSKEKLVVVRSQSVRDAVPNSKPAQNSEQVVCPVCGLTFGVDEAVGTYTHENNVFHFLIKDHMKTFAAEPHRYLPDKKEASKQKGRDGH
ncbi:MAG: hypothetical protein GY847_10410 [Proteobacteria bacterium]|nr:hypothetical protein [Pseudomonadota bacterium]